MAKSDIDSTGTLYINNNGGDITFGGYIIPKASGTLDLGTSGVKWRTLYVGNGTDATSTSTGAIQADGGIAATGTGYFGGKVTADSLKITSTASGVNHIEFSRDYNYFKGPASSTFVFLVNGKNAGSSTDGDLLISDGYVYPGTTEVTTLGKSDKRWTNVYSKAINVSGNATISGNITVSGTAAIAKDTTIGNGTASTSMTTGALKVSGGVGVTGQLNAKTVRVDNAVYF
jgi:cytoskeletal protein CcmA (bactofilin family)